MNTKQTPEQAADEVLRAYNGPHTNLDSRGFLQTNRDNARQDIIKAFQDRERLLEAMESLSKNKSAEYGHDHEWMASDMRATARAAIDKVKS